MPRPPIGQHWRDAIWQLHAADRSMRAPAIARQLARRRAELHLPPEEDDPAPSDTTIRKVLASFSDLGETTRRGYELIRWPESLDGVVLPRQAAASVLALMRIWRESGFDDRPTVRLARWFWDLECAAPDLPERERFEVARDLVMAEVLGVRRTDIEWWLAFTPWRGELALAAYEAASVPVDSYGDRVEEAEIPRYTIGRVILPLGGGTLGTLREALVHAGTTASTDAMPPGVMTVTLQGVPVDELSNEQRAHVQRVVDEALNDED